MARRVFFSFQYDRDIRRVVQIRNSWRIRPENETQPFMDKADWESLRRTGDAAVERWIEKQLVGTSVTVILIGATTFDSKWVRHEIKRSFELEKGILGIYIHNVRDPHAGTDPRGKNPLDHWTTARGFHNVSLSTLYPTYDWVVNKGYQNFSTWIETAAKAAGL